MPFDHKKFFDAVRDDPFQGTLNQSQVDGMEAILTAWETYVDGADIRKLAYMLATTYHETGAAMQPVEEYGKGKGEPYGAPDPETGECYYGRGFVQLTWRDNYQRADKEIGCDSVHHADQQLQPLIAARTMYFGMMEGWFRASDDGKRQTLPRYFNLNTEDSYGAREIINGDKHIVPDWSSGVDIGTLVSMYYDAFVDALLNAQTGQQPVQKMVTIAVTVPEGVQIEFTVNGEAV